MLTVKEIKAEKAAKLALTEGEEIPAESEDTASDGAFAAEETTHEDEGDTANAEDRTEDADHD